MADITTNLPQKYNKPVGIIFALIGISILVFSFYFSTGNVKFLKTAAHTDGTVTELIQRISSGKNAGYTYAPKISFTANDGKEYIVISNSSSNPPSYHAGQKVDVLYNPQSPYDFRINSFFELWGISLILSFMGIIFFVSGIKLLFISPV